MRAQHILELHKGHVTLLSSQQIVNEHLPRAKHFSGHSPTTSHTLGIPPDGSSLSAIHLCVLGAQHGACHTADPVKWMNSFDMSCQYNQDTALTHKRAHFPEGKHS